MGMLRPRSSTVHTINCSLYDRDNTKTTNTHTHTNRGGWTSESKREVRSSNSRPPAIGQSANNHNNPVSQCIIPFHRLLIIRVWGFSTQSGLVRWWWTMILMHLCIALVNLRLFKCVLKIHAKLAQL